jgi:hypothetical protein
MFFGKENPRWEEDFFLLKNLWSKETAIAITRLVKKKCIQGLYLYVLLEFILGFWTLSATFTGKI